MTQDVRKKGQCSPIRLGNHLLTTTDLTILQYCNTQYIQLINLLPIKLVTPPIGTNLDLHGISGSGAYIMLLSSIKDHPQLAMICT